jgi:hypothetical protein
LLPRRTNVIRSCSIHDGFLFFRVSFHRLSLSRSPKIVLDVIRGGARQRARKSRHSLVFGRSARIGAMMQSCASAAKLRGGGSILHSGVEAMVFTSDHRHLGFIGKP